VNGVETAIRDFRTSRLEYMLTLQARHFAPTRRGYGPQREEGQLTVECLVADRRTIVANSTRTIWKQARNSGPIAGYVRPTRDQYTAAEHQSHHRGVACHSYLLLQGRLDSARSVLQGSITGSVLEDITNPSKTAPHRYEAEMDPISLLNVLGFHGHRVVAVTTTSDNYMVWTLERRNYEMHDEL